ncbi:glycoside hydrolase [Paenibacillus psychroresistens]|uniref:Glycoside hydrolase n=1 Tax=Paenibacillus psychroresistens TaxID=1778678 RepID=A0A6B8RSR0_9BACL|nr:glycoside hydrolase family 31 protein [Paenibacillus psychroresistens]QGQ98782.1 glycoside hydrolase [Paenibacillus psychroresistens]
MATEKKIKLLADEYWWGGVVNDGSFMPYGNTDYSRDLRDMDENQASPLLLSSKGRFIWSEQPYTFTFNQDELAINDADGSIIFGQEHQNLATAFKHVSQTYFPPSGTFPDPLAFLAPQYNTWVEMFYEPTQEKVIQYAESILENGFPPGVLILDDNWMIDYGNWEFNKARFPNPKEMIRILHELGFKVMLWVCPYVSPDSPMYRSLSKKGYLLQTENGESVIRQWWNGYSAMIDYSMEAAVEWFHEQLDYLVSSYGIDGFKFDAGEPMISEASDATKHLWRNPFANNDDCEAYAKLGTKYLLSEYRMCWKLGGQSLIQRQRDKAHQWGSKGLIDIIPNGILQGLMGYPYNCPDMIGGGLDGDFNSADFILDKELFVRYAQCSALFPMMQFSLGPWRVLDGEYLEYCKDMMELRKELGHIILELAVESSKTGAPIMRHLDYVFPNAGFELINDQFMLGDHILVAPVLVKGQTRRYVHFPVGTWLGDDGSIVQGPTFEEVDAPISRLPWYREAGFSIHT